MVGGVPMSALVAEADEPRAVVLALHGGATTSAYFDCPGHPRLSLLRTGAALGYTVIAMDRPGYGASAPYPEATQRPDQRVELIYGALDKLIGSDASAGVFVVAHSMGCELAVRMAADVAPRGPAGPGVGRYRSALPAAAPTRCSRTRRSTGAHPDCANCSGSRPGCIPPRCWVTGCPPVAPPTRARW